MTINTSPLGGNGGIPADFASSDILGARRIKVASDTFNADDVVLGNVPDAYIVEKFGRNRLIDQNTTPEDIWNGGGIYTGFTDLPAEEFEVFSSSANDTLGGTGANILRVFYFDADYNWVDENGDFLFFDVNLNGITVVPSGITGIRIWRARAILSGSNRKSVGDITIRWATSGSIFAVIPAGFSQTQICCFTIPAGFTGYLKQFSAELEDQNANRAEMALRVVNFGTNTERLIRPFTITDLRSKSEVFYGAIMLPEKADVAMTVLEVTSNGARVTADFSVLLVKNKVI